MPLVSLHQSLDQVMAEVEIHHQSGGVDMVGLPTGLETFDDLTGGLRNGAVYVLGGRPGMGKTALALTMATNAANAGNTTLYVSLEMNAMLLGLRVLSGRTGIPARRIERGQLSDDEITALRLVSTNAHGTPLAILDEPMTSDQLLDHVKRFQEKHGLQFLVLDYLSLLTDEQRFGEHERVTRISRNVLALARELNIPVLMLAQLNREVERREGNIPSLSDLRDCLAGDAVLVDADTGYKVPIRDIRPGQRILAVDHNDRLVAARVADHWHKGVQQLFRVTTQSGCTVCATANHPFLTPSGYTRLADLAPGDRLATMIPEPSLSANFAWDSVAAITPDRLDETYDIRVPATGNFVANGFVVHNSGAIEQDAYMVMFAYRPHYYEMMTEGAPPLDVEKDARIIIAKHRQGESGSLGAWFYPQKMLWTQQKTVPVDPRRLNGR